MYSVEIDRSKHLLVISALRQVTAEQAKLAAQQVRDGQWGALMENIVARVEADVRIMGRWLTELLAVGGLRIARMEIAENEKRAVSVSPAANRNSRSPNCRPLRICTRARVRVIQATLSLSGTFGNWPEADNLASAW